MLEKKRVLLTIPIPLLDETDKVAAALRLSRGEFFRQSISRSLAEFHDGGGELPPPSVAKTWSIFAR